MKPKGEEKVWNVEVFIEETADETEAKAVVDLGDRRFGGWGRARRSPDDPEVPRVGEELAVARALADLSHQLLDEASVAIERFTGRPARVHS